MDDGLDCSSDCFNDQLEDAVHTELRQTGESAFRRQQSAMMSLNRSKEQVTSLESQLNRTVRELNEAMSDYDDALRSVMTANMTLIMAQQALDNATDGVREVMESASRLCMDTMCEEICTPLSLTCYMDTYITETARCPYTDTEERTVRVEPFFETRRVWSWETECYDPDDDTFICSNDDCIPNGNLVCYGVCVPGYEETPIFRYENITVMIQKFRSCSTGGVFNGSIPIQCNTSCGIQTPNATCVEQNTICRGARQMSLEELEKTREDVVQPLRYFDEARQNVSVQNSNVAITNARIMSLRQKINQIQPVYQSAMEASNLAELNLQTILNDIESDLAIYQRYENFQGNDILRIVNVTFNITITTQSPSQIPLVVTYTTPFNNGDFQKEVTFNFNTPAELSLTQLALEIIAETSLNSLMIQKRAVMSQKKVRRQTEPESDLNRQQFEQNCADLQNVHGFLEYITDSFLQIDESLETAREGIMTLQDDSNQINPADIIDVSILETVFNVAADENTFEELRERVSQDEEYNLNNILRETYTQLIADNQQAAEDTAFPDWQARLEILYNQSSSIGGYPCLSFTDCLLTATDILEQLISNTPGEAAQSLLAALPDARNELVQLGTAMDLTIPQAVDKIRPILDILVEYSENGYWCASIPQITLQPPAEVNVSSSGTLDLECQADTDPAVPSTFQWKKDGNPIPGTNTNQLTIENMQRLDTGNYTCCVSNPVGTAQSINTSVLVYELPEFYLTPVPTSVYEGQDNGARLLCNATAWPYPGWRWYFGPTENSSSMSVIDGEETNQLLIPEPQRRHEGWYACEAYNGHGSIRADAVYLRVLPVTVSQQAIPIEFQVAAPDTSDSDNQCTMQALQSAVQNFIMETIASDTTLISNLELRKVSATLYTVTLYLISQNVTSDDTRISTLIEIANRALPTRATLQSSITALRAAAQRDDLAIECGGVYRVVRGSLTTQKVTYMCPPGQQLSRNFLLCVSCEPGSYSSYRERSRVFNGEGLTERVPECIPCSVGSYEPRVGSDECVICPEFHTTSSQGAVSRRQCTADPLLFECSVEGSTASNKIIDCLTNRPIVNSMCSFDDGIQQSCELPIAVDVQTFGPGFHSVAIGIVDGIGFTAETTVVYELEMESSSNSFALEQSSYTTEESDGFIRVCVDYQIAPGSSVEITLRTARLDEENDEMEATEGVDYIGAQHTFGASNLAGSECVSITILDDISIEEQETFAVQLIVDGDIHSTALVILEDDDVITLTLEQSNYTRQESTGFAQVCVQYEVVREDTTVAVTLQTTSYRQENRHTEATEGVDYIGTTYTFMAGSPGGMECIRITIVDDASIEDQENFAVQVTVNNQTHATTVVTIVDDDVCGGTLIGDRGSFSTPNWPETYLSNVDCEWNIELEDQSKAIEFNFNTSAYGIAGRPPCARDWVEIGYHGAAPIGRFCFIKAPTEVISSAYQATVRFHAGPRHANSRKGFRINYYPVTRPKGLFTCGRFLSDNTPFGPPGFPRLLTSHSTRCVWRYIGPVGTRAQLKLFFFDIPESSDCSRNSLILHYHIYTSGTPVKTLCGTLSEHVFTSNSRIMTVTLNVRDYNTFRGFHAVFEQL